MLEARPPSVADARAASGSDTPAPADRHLPAGDGAAEELAAEVARSVRELRVAAGLSERAAARILSTSQTQLRRMEDRRYLPSLRSLARLAAAYGHRLRIAFEPRTAPAAAAKERAAKAARAPRPKPTPPRVRRPVRPVRGRARRRGESR